MADRGRNEKVTDEQILRLLRGGDRPVWSAPALTENVDVTRQTAHKRLERLAENRGDIQTMQIGNATVYYPKGQQTGSEIDPDAPLEERHKQSLIREFEDQFVGLPSKPWTAVHPNDGPAEAGDKIQLQVEGVPGNWRTLMTRTWDSARPELLYEETSDDETQALISGELYAKPTTPIEHTNYPDDYDLELNIGGQYQEVEGRSRPILVAAGVKNYLIKPCNNAVFLTGVSVDWMSPKGHGQELETVEITSEMIEGVEEAREEAAEAREEYKQGDSPADVEAEPPGFEFVEQMLDAAEPAEGWLKNIISLGAISLDEETVDLLVNHENSPVDSEEELQALVDEVAEEHGGEDAL